MPFHDSRLGPGTLLIGATPGTDFSFQVSACTLTPAVDSTDGTPTLAVPDPAPETKTNYTLDFTAINDFEATSGLNRYAFENDGLETDFVWTPNTTETTPAVLTGRCVVRAFPIGGTVGEQITTDASWPVVGKPALSGGVAATEAAA